MANIHAMYGVMSELHANAEEARAFLFQTLVDLKNDEIQLAQLEFPTTGGIRIIPLSELPPSGEVTYPGHTRPLDGGDGFDLQAETRDHSHTGQGDGPDVDHTCDGSEEPSAPESS